ncbi:MAG: molecular chaperone DnaJ [Candidatus Sungbacteria bacterium]|nr:molecular chaperone DnaJ [Candidatus Sungbacteria bacterium]
MPKDFYSVLGIPKNASQEEIKKAYRKLAHQYHPDKGGGDDAKFKEINEAYQVLGDEKKRQQYDNFGQAFNSGGGFGGGFDWGDIFKAHGQTGGIKFDFGENSSTDFDIGDILEGVFGFSANRGSKKKRGKDIVVELTIPFEESILGGKESIALRRVVRCTHCGGMGGEPGAKTITCNTCGGKGNIQHNERTFLGSITRVETCPACRGKGEIPSKPCTTCSGKGAQKKEETLELIIPKGIRPDESIKLTGKGDISDPTGTPGDLYIRLKVTPHRVFSRQGDDLVMKLPVKISQAILGSTVAVQTLEGEINLKIPEGTQSGDILRVRGKGVPEARGYQHGDLLVEIKVEIPRRISKQLRELMEKLRMEGL